MWCPGLAFGPTIPNAIAVTDLEKATGKYTVLSATDCPYWISNPLLITDNYVINSVNMLCIRWIVMQSKV